MPVAAQVPFHQGLLGKASVAAFQWALKRLFSCVSEPFARVFTAAVAERGFPVVGAPVPLQITRLCKGSCAADLRTAKGSLPRMDAQVSSQIAILRKLFATAVIRAWERFDTAVPEQVDLQGAVLAKGFRAVFMLADKGALSGMNPQVPDHLGPTPAPCIAAVPGAGIGLPDTGRARRLPGHVLSREAPCRFYRDTQRTGQWFKAPCHKVLVLHGKWRALRTADRALVGQVGQFWQDL